MLLYVRLQASCLHTRTQMPKDCDQTTAMMTPKPQIHNLWWLEIIKSEYTRAAFFSTSDRASKEVRNKREPDLRVE